MPWGHIAGKAWGKPSRKPVLAVHGKGLPGDLTVLKDCIATECVYLSPLTGYLDNAGSFDKLIPLLSKGMLASISVLTVSYLTYMGMKVMVN